MPTYSYKCRDCGTAFDIQQAFTDDSLTECPSCGGELRKVFSAIGVTFNGSGFYRNDSRAGRQSESGSSGSSSSTSSSSSGDTSSSAAPKSDSKPSAPTESKKAASPPKVAS